MNSNSNSDSDSDSDSHSHSNNTFLSPQRYPPSKYKIRRAKEEKRADKARNARYAKAKEEKETEKNNAIDRSNQYSDIIWDPLKQKYVNVDKDKKYAELYNEVESVGPIRIDGPLQKLSHWWNGTKSNGGRRKTKKNKSRRRKTQKLKLKN